MRYIVMIIIGIISAGYGLYLLAEVIHQGYNYLNEKHAGKLTGALLLIIIGTTLFLYGISRFIKKQKQKKLKTQYRMQPWKWRADWANAKAYSNKGTKIYVLVFGLIWSAAIVPIMLASGPEMKKEAPLIFYWVFAIGFPMIGFVMIFSSLLQWTKFFIIGRTPINLLNLPGKQGESYEITLDVPIKNQNIKWNCEVLCLYNYIKTTRQSNSTTYTPVRDELWKRNMDIEIVYGRTGNMISARTVLAEELPNTGKREKGSIDWAVDVIGTNKKGKKIFEREFIVPIFSNGEDRKDVPTSYESSKMDTDIAEQERQEIAAARNISSFNEDFNFNEDTTSNKLNDLGIFINNEGIKYSDKAWSSSFGKKFAKYAVFFMLILDIIPMIIMYNTDVGGAFDIITIAMLSIFQITAIGLTFVFLILAFNKYEVLFKDNSIIVKNSCFGKTLTQAILIDDIKDITISNTGSSSGSANGRTTNYISAHIEPTKPKSVITKYQSKIWVHDRGFNISPSFEDREIVSSIVELVKLKINK